MLSLLMKGGALRCKCYSAQENIGPLKDE